MDVAISRVRMTVAFVVAGFLLAAVLVVAAVAVGAIDHGPALPVRAPSGESQQPPVPLPG